MHDAAQLHCKCQWQIINDVEVRSIHRGLVKMSFFWKINMDQCYHCEASSSLWKCYKVSVHTLWSSTKTCSIQTFQVLIKHYTIVMQWGLHTFYHNNGYIFSVNNTYFILVKGDINDKMGINKKLEILSICMFCYYTIVHWEK